MMMKPPGPKPALLLPLLLVLLHSPSILAKDPAQTAATVCAACHGVDGNSTDPAYPKLAGMNQEYLLRQLRAFASGKRRDEAMTGIIAGIDVADFPALAAYYGKQKRKPGVVRDAGLAAQGKRLYEDGNTESGVPACAGCHQPDGEGNARFPLLAGQHQAYILKQMADYRSGRRATDPLMTAVSKRLTTEETKALAEYIAGL
ncbi:MAG: cytochrome c4 [Sulfuritalea sp.]|nr:cytochrome c4 [Sulfuritalea sp.]